MKLKKRARHPPPLRFGCHADASGTLCAPFDVVFQALCVVCALCVQRMALFALPVCLTALRESSVVCLIYVLFTALCVCCVLDLCFVYSSVCVCCVMCVVCLSCSPVEISFRQILFVFLFILAASAGPNHQPSISLSLSPVISLSL